MLVGALLLLISGRFGSAPEIVRGGLMFLGVVLLGGRGLGGIGLRISGSFGSPPETLVTLPDLGSGRVAVVAVEVGVAAAEVSALALLVRNSWNGCHSWVSLV